MFFFSKNHYHSIVVKILPSFRSTMLYFSVLGMLKYDSLVGQLTTTEKCAVQEDNF